MTRLLSNLLYRLWLVTATIIILIAVLISISRLLLPLSNDYKPEIESWLSEQTGRNITIGEIRSNWKTLGPSLTLHDVEIENLIYIGSLQADIKTIPSLFYRNLITDNLTISGVNFIITQQADGTFDIAQSNQTTTSLNGEGLSIDTIQDWLQSQTSIRILEANIVVSLRDGKTYPINISQMEYASGSNMYQLRGFSELPGANRIDFTFEADGYLSDPSTVGQLYIDTHTLDLTQLPLAAFWQEAKIQHGDVKLNIWVDWRNQQFQSAVATLDIDDFQLTLQEIPQGHLNRLTTQLLWKRLPDGWQLQTNNAQVISHQREWPAPFVQARLIKHEDNSQQFYVNSSRMDVGIWADVILAKQDLDTSLRRRLLAMNPQGYLDAVQIDAHFLGSNLQDLNLTARFSELAFESYGATPGISNMAGQVQLQKDSGNLYLDTRYASFNDPQLFRWELPIDYLNTDIDWSLKDDHLKLTIQHFTAHVHGAQLASDGDFEIALDSGQVFMNLYAELTNGDMEKTPHFLPYGIMSDELVDYLDGAVKSGSLSEVKVLLRGDGSNFPFTDGSGVFAIHGIVENGVYEFEPSWPALTNMSADLFFIGNGMDIRVNSAVSHQHQIDSASAIITDFSVEPTTLLIDSNSHGDLQHAPDYLLNSPLKDDLQPLTDTLSMQGDFNLALNLIIPLDDSQEHVTGNIEVKDANALVNKINLPATNINGSLQIENRFVTSKDLSATILGGKSRINLNQSREENGISSNLRFSGDLQMAAVYESFAQIIPPGLSGGSPYQGTVEIPAGESENFTVSIDTRTQGVTSELPHPLSKTPDVGLPLNLTYEQLDSENARLELSWLDKLTLKTRYVNDEVTSGVIALGMNEAEISDRAGIEITGTADRLDLVSWLEYLSNAEEAQSGQEDIEYDQYYLNELSIDQLDYFFLGFKDTKVSGSLGSEQLDFFLDGADIKGNVQIPLPIGQNPIVIDLETLKIADLFADENESDDDDVRTADASPLPPIQLSCATCLYVTTELGPTTVTMSPLENGNQVSVKVTRDNILSMDINGSWTEESDVVTTAIEGEVKTGNLGRIMNILHLDAGVRDTPMTISGNLSWQGDPAMFNTETMSGNVNINGGKGSQKQLSDRGARLFTLFSLGSIARKLTLDFSDLFEDGFFYTGMSGNFTADDGVFTTEDFAVRGTSADVEVRGKADFANNQIEQCILVTPDLSSSLPVLAGWAIEPVTGFVVFLMSKIFQPALDVVTSIRYQVEGSFDDPVVTEIGKSRARATISEDKDNPSIQVEDDEEHFSCNDEFK